MSALASRLPLATTLFSITALFVRVDASVATAPGQILYMPTIMRPLDGDPLVDWRCWEPPAECTMESK